MTVVLDSSLLWAQHDRDAPRHETATTAMEAVGSGRYGQPIVTDYIYDEVVTLARARTGVDSAVAIGKRIRGAGEFPAAIDLQFLNPTGFERAVTLFERLADQDLSFTDATIVAHVRIQDIDHVLTFDDDFDGVINRLDPATF